MRKKSHILLARYIAKNTEDEELKNIDCLFILAASCRIVNHLLYIRNMKSMGRFRM